MAPHSEERLKISVAQKKAIRHYHKMQKPRVGHKHINQWFNDEYGIDLPLSTISNILSSKFDHLDHLGSTHDEAKRCRPPKYPDLEIALAECISRMKAAGIDLTGAVLLSTAHELWPSIPVYHGQPIPTLSGGWVEKFKTRHKIKLRSFQVEAASTRANQSGSAIGASSPLDTATTGDIKSNTLSSLVSNPSTQHTLENIRQQARNYPSSDIFTMTETELFWRLTPNTQALREVCSLSKRDNKERVTIALACNASGTQRLPPWIVGHYQSPRSFNAPGNDIRSLNCLYSSNVIAWMTVSEWRKWIKWFDSMMDRPVLLILHPHRAHEISYSTLSDTYTLRNTQIVFLPPNASPLYQPMELGILQNFKSLYRKSLLSFISEFYSQGDIEICLPPPVSPKTQDPNSLDNDDKGITAGLQFIDQISDPHQAINLYIAAYWIQKAWVNDMSPSSIIQSWSRSSLLEPNYTSDGLGAPLSPKFVMAPPHGNSIPSATALSNPSSVISPGVVHEISRLIQLIRTHPGSLKFMGHASESLQLNSYICPLEETILERVEDFIELCTAQFYDTELESNIDPIYIIAPVSSKAASQAVKLLLSFEEQHADSNLRFIQLLSEYRDTISQRFIQKPSRQASIASIVEPLQGTNHASLIPSIGPISALGSLNQNSMMMSVPVSHTPLSAKPSESRKRRTSSQDSRSSRKKSMTLSRNNSYSSTSSTVNSGNMSMNAPIMGSPTSIISSGHRNSVNLSNNPLSLPSAASSATALMSLQPSTNSNAGYYSAVGMGQLGINNMQSQPSNIRGIGMPSNVPGNPNSLFPFNNMNSYPPGSSNVTSESSNTQSAVSSYPNLSHITDYSSFLSNPPPPAPSSSSSSTSGSSNQPGIAPSNTNNPNSFMPYASNALPPRNVPLPQPIPPQSGTYSPTNSLTNYPFFNANSAPVYYPAHAS